MAELVLLPIRLNDTMTIVPDNLAVDGHERNLLEDSTDVPEMPFWQTSDLVPVAHPPPWMEQTNLVWLAITPTDATRAYKVALRLAQMLIEIMRSDPGLYQPLRSILNDLWLRIVEASSSSLTRRGDPLTAVDRVLLATMGVYGISPFLSDISLKLSLPISVSLDDTSRLAALLEQRAPLVRDQIQQYLAQLGLPIHWWSEALVFGLMVHPQGIAWVRPPFRLGPKPRSLAFERGIEVALGVPDQTYRIASKFHRTFLAVNGVSFMMKRRGAKPGNSRKKPHTRLAFEKYVLARSDKGFGPEAIAEDSESQRLYRVLRNDTTVILNVQAVRRAIRTGTS